MVWEKVMPNMAGEIYLMQNNGYGWGGESVVVNSSYDDISPSIAQLNNGTILLVWSRGSAGSFNSYNIYAESYTKSKWTKPSALIVNSPSNFDPVLTKTTDGTVWLVWSRSSSTNGSGDLYYRTLQNGSWTNENAIPTASNPTYEEKLPSITQTADGKIWVCYESNANGTAQLYCTTNNGANWSSPIHVTTTSDEDKWPSIVQDRNGTMWIFWARELANGTSPPPSPQPLYQWDIFYKSSTNNGTSWTMDADLYSSVSTVEEHPTVFQGPDKTLWIVYDSCCNSPGNPYGSPNLFIAKSSVILAHDMAISSIAFSPSPRPRIGENVTFTVAVSDLGPFSESSTISLYVNSTLVETRSISVSSGSSRDYTLVWSSTGAHPGKYSALAVVTPVSHEFVTSNNNLTLTFCLTFGGDVNRDGKVSIEDLSTIAAHFGTISGSANYYAPADLNSDGKINLIDLILCSTDFGKFS